MYLLSLFLSLSCSQVVRIRMWWCLTAERSKSWLLLKATPKRSPLSSTTHLRYTFFLQPHNSCQRMSVHLLSLCVYPLHSRWCFRRPRTAPSVCGHSQQEIVCRWLELMRQELPASPCMLLEIICSVPLRIR